MVWESQTSMYSPLTTSIPSCWFFSLGSPPVKLAETLCWRRTIHVACVVCTASAVWATYAVCVACAICAVGAARAVCAACAACGTRAACAVCVVCAVWGWTIDNRFLKHDERLPPSPADDITNYALPCMAAGHSHHWHSPYLKPERRAHPHTCAISATMSKFLYNTTAKNRELILVFTM